MAKMWDGRFSALSNELMEAFNSSIHIDKRLVYHDILGSMAHVQMLHHIGFLTDIEKEQLIKGLKAVEEDFKLSRYALDDSLEDIHMAVETFLTAKIGDLGKKLHTGRSRNDQVAVDIRLFAKDKAKELQKLLKDLIRILISQSKDYIDVIMPGFTHLQKAQPIRLSYHLMAYVQMFKRDYGRLEDAYKRMDECPLGVGAFAGVNYENDRSLLSSILGFSRITENGMDTVSDRDFLIELMGAMSLIMTHLSRFAEELIIWSSNDYGYIVIGDEFSTGSSIMPQKKNPDAAELIRGKTGRVHGQLINLLTVMKGIPLAYNKDMQEDKESFFDALDTTSLCLRVMLEMLKTVSYKEEKMLQATKDGFLNATDLADYLVGQGIAFRQAHKIVGELVKICVEQGITLEQLSEETYKNYNIVFTEELLAVLDIENCVENKQSYGGTSKESVKKMIDLSVQWLTEV